MKLLLLIPVALLCGCSATNVSKWQKALAGDKAIAVVRVRSVYGTADLTRVGETTNSVNILPDGTVQINHRP